MEDFKKELEAIKSIAKDQFTQLEGKTEAELKEMKSVMEKANELAGKVNDKNIELAKKQEAQQDQMNETVTKLKEYQEKAKKSEILSPREWFAKELKESKEFADFKEHGRSTSLRVDEKAMNDMFHKTIMTTAASFTGDVVPVDRISNNTWAAPHEMVRARSLINFGTTSSNTVDFVRQTGGTQAAASVTEGNEKAESSEELTAVQASVQTLAHVFRISKQALEDYQQMATYLTTECVAGLKDVEDTQILSGSGVAPNLSGIITQATTAFAGGAATDNKLDTLLKAIYILKAKKYMPTAIVVDTASMRAIKLIKDTSGQYIFPNFLPLGLANPVSIDGVPVIEHTAMASDTYLVGDFSRATGWDREAANVRFSEENEDNFVKNLVSVRVEERLALAVYRPDAFLSDRFAGSLS